MRIFEFFRPSEGTHSSIKVITFTGGMGAQILSASIYYDLLEQGRPVYADLSYFEKDEKVAVVGDKGVSSHWGWQLDGFGIDIKSFSTEIKSKLSKSAYLHDGALKMELALQALSKKSIREKFPVSLINDDLISEFHGEKYACLHVRRGDYLNVASHLVSDDEFLSIANKVSNLISNLVIISDSTVEDSKRTLLSRLFKNTIYLDKTDAFTSHTVMRCASLLVCSNSQFSLVAALLNPDAVSMIPTQWFGGEDRSIELPLHSRSAFQILTS